MKAKLFISLIIAFTISCSPKEEKKEDKPKEEAPIEESAPEEAEAPMEEIAPEEVPAPIEPEESVKKSSDESGLESIGTGGGTSSGSGTGNGSGNGTVVKPKKIEVQKDITVGEEGVR